MELTTRRLRLVPWTEADAAELFELARNTNVGPHAGWKPHESLEESLAVIREILIPVPAFKILSLETDLLMGCIALEPDRHRDGIRSRELGYWMGKPYWGQGRVTEAAAALLDYGFSELDLELVSVCTSPANKRSQRVIEKLGFTFEGRRRRCYRVYDGSIRDSLYYSLLREEWMGVAGK